MAPNTLAYLVLALWPLVMIWMFRKMEPGRAIIWSLLLAYLFLPPPPAGFDPPLMPPITKETLPPVVAFVLVFLMRGRELRLWPRSNVAKILMAVFVASPMATVLTNAEPIFFGQVGIRGLRVTEGIALMVQQAMLLLPFILARNFLSEEGGQRDLMIALVIAGLIYSLLMLIEVRLSPQLNLWVYGYYQHYFAQSIRFGGYRPVVFLYHGLWVAFFALMVLAAAAALFRGESGRLRGYGMLATGYMWGVLFLAKSLGAMIYSVALVPLIVFGGRLLQYRAAALLAFLALAYPALKGLHMVPADWLVEQAAAIDADRANSLEFRFDNEQVLLDRAELKPVFGWGSWGRNQIHDPVTGQITTVTDGRWVITIGVYGWVGFIAEFGLLAWPLLLLAWQSTGLGREDVVSPWLGPLALMLGFNLFDLLPNATITTLTFLMAGALLGYLEQWAPGRVRQRPGLRSVM